MIEHKPWIGVEYERSIFGARIAIFGFSHWGKPDNEDFTTCVIRDYAIKGELRFFNRIYSYFKAKSPEEFWNSVLFANTLPSSVGGAEAKYSTGTDMQITQASERIRRIIEAYQPGKALVFSRKAWNIWPSFDGVQEDRYLPVADTEEIEFGTYRSHESEFTVAYGLTHPQFSSTAVMQRCVAAILDHDTSGLFAVKP